MGKTNYVHTQESLVYITRLFQRHTFTWLFRICQKENFFFSIYNQRVLRVGLGPD